MPIAGGHGPIVPAEMAHHESEISAILRGIGITQESEEPLAGTHVPAQGGEKNLCDTAGHNPDPVATTDEKQTQDIQGQGEVDHTSDRSENADQQDLSSDKNSKAGSAEVDVKADQDERQDNSQD
ncbi:hypothetical protein KEM55_001267 [Ascosphaera atra]|nr:hypothetical protein KEM55_001267 [Ascosphaera atra]